MLYEAGVGDASDAAHEEQTTAGTLSLPSARSGRISSHSTGTKRRRLQSALLAVCTARAAGRGNGQQPGGADRGESRPSGTGGG